MHGWMCTPLKAVITSVALARAFAANSYAPVCHMTPFCQAFLSLVSLHYYRHTVGVGRARGAVTPLEKLAPMLLTYVQSLHDDSAAYNIGWYSLYNEGMQPVMHSVVLFVSNMYYSLV